MFVFWASMLTIEAFLVPYLTEIGFSEAQVGLVMAAVFGFSIIAQPFWGFLADRTGAHRLMVAIAEAIAAGVMLLIPAGGRVFALAIAVAIAYSLTASSMPGLIDGWLMKANRSGYPVNYGLARGFGSLGFAIAGAVLGGILERHGLVLMFPIYAVLCGVLIAVVLSTRPVPAASRAERKGISLPDAIRAVATNGRFLALLGANFFIFLGTRAAITFMPLRFYELGGNTTHVGWAQSVNAAAEIPFMFLTAFVLRRVRPRVLLIFAMTFFVVRLVLMKVAATPAALVWAQAVQGISFGFVLPASVHYIDRIAPAEFRSFFQALAPSVYFGLASVVGSSTGGVFVERFGLDALYTVAPFVAGVGVLLFAVSLLAGRRRHMPDAG
jgi:MFS family permease